MTDGLMGTTELVAIILEQFQVALQDFCICTLLVETWSCWSITTKTYENIQKHTKTYKNIQKHTKTCYWAAIFSYQDLIKTHLKNPKPMQLWKLCNSESPLLNALEIDILELDLLSAQSLFPVKNFSDYNWIHVITIYYNGILQTLQTLQTPD